MHTLIFISLSILDLHPLDNLQLLNLQLHQKSFYNTAMIIVLFVQVEYQDCGIHLPQWTSPSNNQKPTNSISLESLNFWTILIVPVFVFVFFTFVALQQVTVHHYCTNLPQTYSLVSLVISLIIQSLSNQLSSQCSLPDNLATCSQFFIIIY